MIFYYYYYYYYIAELLEPLKRMINEVLIPAVTDHTVTKVKRNLLGPPVRMEGLGFTDPVVTSYSEYEASIKVTNPLMSELLSKSTSLQIPQKFQHCNWAHENKKMTV